MDFKHSITTFRECGANTLFTIASVLVRAQLIF